MERRWRRILLIAIVTLAILCVSALILIRHWPFAEGPVVQNLREASDSQLKVRSFRETYFPPGCVLEGVVFDHRPNEAKPLISIEKLTIEGSYSGLLANRVSRITAEGMHVIVPPFGTGAAITTSPSKTKIGEIIADGAVVDFASSDPNNPSLRFVIRAASLHDVSWSGPLTYQVEVRNPEPPGNVTATGKFGVWNRDNAGETPISGEYTFEGADLSVYQGIAGKLSSRGKFEGKLSHIDISGTTDTPDFEVKSGGHPMQLKTEFSAYVDAIHGDTFLKKVEGDFWKTHIVAAGSVVTSANGKGKTALIDFRANQARIEDLLRLFVNAKRAPMSGAVNLKAHVEIPPGGEDFLRKVRLRGSFGIADGIFTAPQTQQDVNKLSSGARGERESTADPETVLTDLAGTVNLHQGTATFLDLSFGVPSAAARLHGTFNLINEKIDLRGQLKLDSEISKTENGGKALLLKSIEPFFKKKKNKRGEVVPVHISGTYEHPSFGLDLNDKNAQSVAYPSHKSSKSVPAPVGKKIQ